MNSKPKATTAGRREARRALADRRRQIVFLVVTWQRLISREWQSGLFEASHKQSSEREYIRLCEVFSPPLLSCIPLLSDWQTHLVDQNNSTTTWRTKSSQNPVFCISHCKALEMITERLRLRSECNTRIVHSIHWILHTILYYICETMHIMQW